MRGRRGNLDLWRKQGSRQGQRLDVDGGREATAAPAPAPAPAAPQAKGTQFITGACTSDADCASACCGFKSGKCAGPVVAQERDGGCGFGDARPNDDAARALQGRSLGRRGPYHMYDCFVAGSTKRGRM